ncbi:histidine phosphatase family protein [Kaarinaea lacus]
MKTTQGLLVACLFVIVACASQPQHQADSLVEQLQLGGYVIFFRHAATDYSQEDTDLSNPTNCEAQRHLSDTGKQQAKEIGEGFAMLGIPVGDVFTSQFCRCSNTAKIAFGKAETTIEITSIQGVTPEERLRRIENLRTMINTPPKPNTNTVLVAHKWMFKEASGQVLEEGEAAIFKPQASGIALMVRRVKAEEWKTLDRSSNEMQGGH